MERPAKYSTELFACFLAQRQQLHLGSGYVPATAPDAAATAAQAATTLASALGTEFSLPPDLTGVLASLDSAVLAPAMQRLLTVVSA